MFSRYFLLNKIVNFLIKKEYEVLFCSSCFDIAAKREQMLIIKALINIDSLNEEQALSLKAAAYFLSAFPFIISLKNNRRSLDNQTIYSRFGLPVLTPQLFENILEAEVSAIQSAKGRHTVEINTKLLRKRREEFNLSLSELAKRVSITKKALYEIENKRVYPSIKTARKIEKVLKVNLRIPYEIKPCNATYLKPKNEFQRKICREFMRIGIDNSAIYSAPFEIVGKEKFSIISTLSRNTKKIMKRVSLIKEISSFFSSRAIFVTKRSHEKSIEGIPIFIDSELEEIDNVKEFDKLIKEKI
jgi:putative transcriptional regulator